MAAIRRLDVVDLVAFAVIVAAAAGARVWYLNTAADQASTSGPLRVQDAQPMATSEEGREIRGRAAGTEMDALADNLKTQNKLLGRAPFASQAEETAHIAPGYPYFLSLLDRFPGRSRRDHGRPLLSNSSPRVSQPIGRPLDRPLLNIAPVLDRQHGGD